MTLSASVDRSAANRLTPCVLALITAVSSLILITPLTLIGTCLLALGCIWVLICIILSVSHGNFDPLLLLWLAIFPLGYYFLSFPRATPLFTLDRATIVLLAFGIFLGGRQILHHVPKLMRLAGIAWAFFLLFAAISILGSPNELSGARTVVEAFIFPAILALYVFSNFSVMNHLKTIHVLVCGLAIYLALIGVAEIYLGRDLMPLPGADIHFSESSGLQLLRVNGPFLSDTSYGLIGLILLFLLFFLKQAARSKPSLWRRILHVTGVASAIAVALMPLFRSIALTLLIVLLLKALENGSRKRRLILGGVPIFIIMGFFWLSSQLPYFYQGRISGMDNIYARVAEEQQSLRIFLSHPLLGVGINNFHDVAEENSNYLTSYDGVDALDYPHSNLSGILAETGVLGFLFYVLAQILLFRAFLQLRKRQSKSAQIAWKYLLWVYLAYWISGLSLTSGYYSDLNLWFMFCIALIYKFGISNQPLRRVEDSAAYA